MINLSFIDSPYSIQKSFFIREKAFIVDPEGGPPPPPTESEFGPGNNADDDEAEEDEADYDYTDFINPRRTPRLFRNYQILSVKADVSSPRLARLLQRLLHNLRGRIS